MVKKHNTRRTLLTNLQVSSNECYLQAEQMSRPFGSFSLLFATGSLLFILHHGNLIHLKCRTPPPFKWSAECMSCVHVMSKTSGEGEEDGECLHWTQHWAWREIQGESLDPFLLHELGTGGQGGMCRGLGL